MDFVGKRYVFLAVSLLVILTGIVSMLIPPAFRVGTEFSGGSALSVTLVQPLAQTALRAELSSLGHSDAVIQRLGDRGLLIRTRTLEEAVIDAEGKVVTPSEKSAILEAIERLQGGKSSILSLAFEQPVARATLVDALASVGHQEAAIEQATERSVTLRTRPLQEAELDAEGKVLKPAEKDALKAALTERLGPIATFEVTTRSPVESSEFTSVSPVVARETVRNAILAVVLASVAILLYISWAFRRVPNPFVMGSAAIIALMHDVMVTLGVFSILGKFINVEVNAIFITAVLTVVGYSVHDTIVVFDRIRENAAKNPSRELASVINFSIVETMSRSLNTSLTTLIVIVALLLLGGPTIQSFLTALLIGIVTGTYSSIAIASQLLVVWEKREWLRPFGRGRREQPLSAGTEAR